MRILYLHQYYNSTAMAGSTRSFEMARRFVEAGHEVDLITSRRDGSSGTDSARWTESREEGVRVHWCSVPYANAMGYRRRISAFVRFARLAATKAVQVGGDVVFATSTPLTIVLPGVYASRRLGCPLVLELRDLWPEVPIALGALRDPFSIGAARLLETVSYKAARAIVTLSPTAREQLLARGYAPEKVCVIPNASDTHLFDPGRDDGQRVRLKYPWLGNRPMVLYAGTLGAANGVEYLVEVAQIVRDHVPEVRFVIVGDGAKRGSVESAARRAGLLDSTLFMLPPAPKQQIVEWFSAADIVTSLFVDNDVLWANSANKFFDGLAAGRPLAINYAGWQAQLLRGENAGIVMPPGDAAEAGRQLVELLRSPERQREMGVNARRLAETRFDRNALAAELLGVLTGVAGA